MALALGDLHRLTVEDYLALAEVSDLNRTELIEGVIYDVTPESISHADRVEDIFVRLLAIVGRRAHMAGSVQVFGDSLWEPDVYVQREGSERSAGYVSAVDVEMVVEVTRTSLSRDLGPKLRGYAAAGVQAYWVVVPDPGRYALIHTEPVDGTYRQVQRIELSNGYQDLPVEDLWKAQHE